MTVTHRSPRPARPLACRSPRGAALLAGLLLALTGCIEAQDYVDRTPPAGSGDTGSGSGTSGEKVEEPAPGTVRIAALNVHRFFDTVCDSSACGGTNYEELPSPEAFAARAQQLATAIASMKAGVVLVAEVETDASLEAIRSRLPGFSWALLGEIGQPGSVDVGVLSRFPIRSSETRRYRSSTTIVRPDGSTTVFSREFMEVHLDVNGAEVIVFPTHFRSKVSDDPGRRYGEAVAARDIVSRVATQHPGALVVLGGDMNDDPNSEPLTALEQGGAMQRVSSDRPPADITTILYMNTPLAYDHLYKARDSAGQYVAGSFRVSRDGPEKGLGGSDHAAVRADFELPH